MCAGRCVREVFPGPCGRWYAAGSGWQTGKRVRSPHCQRPWELAQSLSHLPVPSLPLPRTRLCPAGCQHPRLLPQLPCEKPGDASQLAGDNVRKRDKICGAHSAALGRENKCHSVIFPKSTFLRVISLFLSEKLFGFLGMREARGNGSASAEACPVVCRGTRVFPPRPGRLINLQEPRSSAFLGSGLCCHCA